MNKGDITTDRLRKADKYCGMCLDSRSVAYAAIPFIIAARKLLEMAIEIHERSNARPD